MITERERERERERESIPDYCLYVVFIHACLKQRVNHVIFETEHWRNISKQYFCIFFSFEE